MTGEATYHSVSVAGVVIDENGRTLIIQRRDNGHWEPPGGVLEREESIIQGLLREVREETGLIVEPMVLTGVYKNMRLGVVALVFRCRPAGGTLTENSEAAGFRWIQESEVSAIRAIHVSGPTSIAECHRSWPWAQLAQVGPSQGKPLSWASPVR